jgi:bifunctional non-homologous end joining protein LigD
MAQEEPERFLAHLKIGDRRGRILVDWLRNGLGATAVASFSPRARSGATVATPVAWTEVTERLDPSQFTVRTVPERQAKLKADPWKGFNHADQRLPDLMPRKAVPTLTGAGAGAEAGADASIAGQRARIVVAHRPKPRR